MPTARELLEQADALMRRNRAAAVDDIPVLTDSVALPAGAVLEAAAVPAFKDVAAPAPRAPEQVPALTEAVAALADESGDSVIQEGEPSDWLHFDHDGPSIIGDAPDSIAIVPQVARPPVPEPAAPDAEAMASAELEEIELTTPADAAFDDEFEPADTYAQADAMPPGAAPAAADAPATPLRVFTEASFAPWAPAVEVPAPPADAEAHAPPPTRMHPRRPSMPKHPRRPSTPKHPRRPSMPKLPRRPSTRMHPRRSSMPKHPRCTRLRRNRLPRLPVPRRSNARRTCPPRRLADSRKSPRWWPPDRRARRNPRPTRALRPSQCPRGTSLRRRNCRSPRRARCCRRRKFRRPRRRRRPAFAPPAVAGAADAEKWDAIAEEIRMQVLQRIDLFTDTGLREQLGMRLKPIVDRASADLVATINLHVGELLRAYVAEAIEREIENWRSNH